jgi:hypothetical protein
MYWSVCEIRTRRYSVPPVHPRETHPVPFMSSFLEAGTPLWSILFAFDLPFLITLFDLLSRSKFSSLTAFRLSLIRVH